MLKVAADENFNNDILRAMINRNPDIDIIRIQDTEMFGKNDPSVLAWTAEQRRVLITHDVKTVTKYAYERIGAGLQMPGVFEVNDQASMGVVIDDLLLLIECSTDDEWEGKVCYVPLH